MDRKKYIPIIIVIYLTVPKNLVYFSVKLQKIIKMNFMIITTLEYPTGFTISLSLSVIQFLRGL